MEEIINTLALARLHGISLPVKKALVERHGSATNLFKRVSQGDAGEGLDEGLRRALSLKIDSVSIKREAQEVLSKGIEIICFSSEKYPPLLKNIADAPLLFYKKGMDIPLDRLFIAVVGSRNATGYGRDYARSISRDLAVCNVAVVSGLASGVDAAAHMGCLDGKGYTVAVLGSGLLRPYPESNTGLLKRIESEGTVISEFDIYDEPRPENFPRRNRIISGLSQGVFVTEAAQRSGARITARLALEQNREVFALPGRADSKMSEGTNALIRDGLAKLATNAVDILVEFEKYYGVYKIKPGLTAEKTLVKTTQEEKDLLAFIAKGESVDIDELAKRSSLSINKILDIILQLELKGAVVRKPGNMIVREM